jgi:nitroimidazol reductase NimA-like FMN-containing flavoprotein (pyridoxamine 5'-phosphate oxidase superfamily)
LDNSLELRQRLGALVESQRFAVLSTQSGGQPYSNLVAFAATDDLKHLLFATPRGTRKYANLSREKRVAILVDNRSNEESDFRDAIAATATGTAEELSGPEKEALLARYLEKHPTLEGFVSSPTSAFFKVSVDVYYVVSRFQKVMELRVSE